MKTQVIGIGAGGHAKVIIEMLQMRDDVNIVGLLDANTDIHGREISSVPVLGNDSMLNDLYRKGIYTAFIAIGSTGISQKRIDLFKQASAMGFKFLTIVHPSAIISPSAVIEHGSVILAGAVISTGVKIGINAIINSRAVVEHHCHVGNHVHIASGAIVAGAVTIEDRAFIGAGATIRQSIKIGEDAIIGAGSVVTKNIKNNTTVVGVPAKEINS